MSKRTGTANLSAYKRRKYAELKDDPEMYERFKEKERLRYLKKKEKRQVIPIEEKSPRDQRQQRKKWREASKKYREKKRAKGNESMLPEVVLIKSQNQEDTSSETTTQTSAAVEKDPVDCLTTLISQKIRHIRYIEQKKRKSLIKIVQDLRKENENLKKKLRQVTVDKLQMTSRKIQKGDKIKSKPAQPKNKNLTGPKLISLIKKFFEQDSNSIIIPGKKQYITRNKVQKQKRQLILPLKQLHNKLILEHGIRVSYAFFCRHRPFWVIFPTKALRETCACAIHSNIDLAVQCLQKADIIRETNFEQLLESLCCSRYNDNCLKRECASCKDKVLSYKEFSNDQSLTLYHWVRCKETVKTKKGMKTQYVTMKKATEVTPLEAINTLDNLLPTFYKHSYNINVQHNTTKQKKGNLIVSEAFIHIDFSENFGLKILKYGKEVQSLHFGPSRKENCLHTGVIYTYDFQRSAIGTTCACTVSQCLRHDASAIWAHLLPMIKLAIEINLFIDTIHFQSDSPSSQYRNKYIFSMITVLCKDFPQLKAITWNYSEAGHGKGAPDGIGAVLKRTADKLVNFGQDVSTFREFIDIMKQNVENITIMTVDEDEVLAKEALLPKDLKPFKGTLNVHQVLWQQRFLNLVFRNASCFDCEYISVHDKHIGLFKVPNYCQTEEESPASSSGLASVAPLVRTKNCRSILTNISNTSHNINITTNTPKNIVILSNKKVISCDFNK
ncbi:hypothetical protein HF086_012313 [Spodoptera exigua]|uniref:Uncharacterized protein n=1 Tax=Spodoptera exigua TaxID=7107 RepID=A0A922MUD5_SPOEX|nr:hypothetical protein HF086_012313 [Spodoptera exigua]